MKRIVFLQPLRTQLFTWILAEDLGQHVGSEFGQGYLVLPGTMRMIPDQLAVNGLLM
jgi:hypothetical protein